MRKLVSFLSKPGTAAAITVAIFVGWPATAAAVENAFAIRLGPTVAASHLPLSYEGHFSAPGVAATLNVSRRSNSVDVGGRLEAGWVLVFGRATLFPHLALSYTPMREIEVEVPSALGRYGVTTKPTWWTVGISPEVQLVGRNLILAPEIGIAQIDAAGTFRGPGLAEPVPSHRGRIWGRLAVGGRLSVVRGAAVGALLAGEATMPAYVDDAICARALLTAFVEMDGSSW